MADDLVSKVRLEGVDQVEKDFENIARAGEAAMGRISKSTKPASDDIQAVGKYVEAVATRFGQSIRAFASSGQQFISNVGRMAATVTKYAAAAGLAGAAVKKISAANADQATDVKQAIAQSKIQTHGFAEQQARAISNAKAIQDLNDAYGSGKISMEDYAAQSTKLRQDQEKEEEQAKRMELIRSAEAEDRIRQEAAIKKQAAAQKAYSDAVDSFGGDVASALQGLAPAWESFLRNFNQGPSLIADIMRGITQLLSKYGGEIIDTMSRIGRSIAEIFTGGGGADAATTFSEVMIKAFRAVAAVVEGVLIPVFKGIATAMTPIAALFNKLFGTEVTGGMVAAGAALIYFAGGFTLVYNGVMLVVRGIQLMRVAMVALNAASMLNPIVLILAAIVIAIALVVIYWDEIKAAGILAANAIVSAWNNLKTAFNSAVASVVQTWNSGIQWIKDAWNGAINWVVETWNAGLQLIKDAWTAVQEFFSWDNIVKMATDAWNSIVEMVNKAWEALKEATSNAMKSIGTWLLDAVPGLKTLVEWIEKAIAAWKSFTGAKDSAATSGEGKKRGGPIHGRGTSTSDNVPIWASPGEWVIKAKAVQHCGRSFMSAVNSMRLPSGGLDLGGGFLAPTQRLAFAAGGEVPQSGGRPVVLNIGGESFNLVSRDDATAENLTRYAIRRQVRSSGRKPSAWGG